MTTETCTHSDLVEGYCRACGHCFHEVILNGVCMACSQEVLAVTIKPEETRTNTGPANVVLLSELVRKPKS